MSTGLIEIMKIAALDAMENNKPTDLRFGTVTSVDPLKVMISNDFILPESLLIVPEHLTDYSVLANVGNSTGDNTPSGSSSIDIRVEGETLIINTNVINTVSTIDEDDIESVDPVDDRTLTMYNGLQVDDNVVLLRNQGGSSYLILDRI